MMKLKILSLDGFLETIGRCRGPVYQVGPDGSRTDLVLFYQKAPSAALHSLAFHQGVRRSCALHPALFGEYPSIFDFSDTP